MKNRQVTYLISGPAHLPYLICSLWTLRNSGWGGDVAIHCWPESMSLVDEIVKDKRLDAYMGVREPRYRRKDGFGGNSQFLDKIQMSMELQCDVSLYLDADTTVHGDITSLLEYAEAYSFCATQWNDWTTLKGHANRRVRGLLDIPEIPNNIIEKVTSNIYPSVNGGVWATKPSSPVLPVWYEWTKACGRLFISDERVLHLMGIVFPKDFVVLGGGRWNCSPKFQPENIDDKDVIIRHYHGDSNVRPKKSQKGFDLWYPIYQECLEENVGNIQSWIGGIKNKHMNRLKPLPNNAMNWC